MIQLALFAFEASTAPPGPAPLARRGSCEWLSDLIACPVIEAELLEIFRTRPDNWLDWPAFQPVIAKHGVGFGLGHKLGSVVPSGLIEEQVVFLGKGIVPSA